MTNPTFDIFWMLYPKRKAKIAAPKAWKRMKRDDRIAVIEHLPDRLKSDAQWLKNDGEFIPHPATFLNQGCWMDEYQTENQQQPKVKNYRNAKDSTLLNLCTEMRIRTQGKTREELIRALESLDIR